MPSEIPNMDEITEARSKAIAETIHPVDSRELTALGEALFPQTDHPWRERFLSFIQENAGASFYHATTNDRIHIVYCRAKEKGMWFMPGSGVGPLQPKGLAILKEIVDGL